MYTVQTITENKEDSQQLAYSLFIFLVGTMGRRTLPAVRDLTRDGRWSTYDVSVLKLFRGRCARMGNTLKLPSPTKLARLGHFPPASGENS